MGGNVPEMKPGNQWPLFLYYVREGALYGALAFLFGVVTIAVMAAATGQRLDIGTILQLIPVCFSYGMGFMVGATHIDRARYKEKRLRNIRIRKVI